MGEKREHSLRSASGDPVFQQYFRGPACQSQRCTLSSARGRDVVDVLTCTSASLSSWS
jgi:hypothetical protein